MPIPSKTKYEALEKKSGGASRTDQSATATAEARFGDGKPHGKMVV